MKQFTFIFLVAAALGTSAPAAAQTLTSAGNDFIEAVKKSDGGKATNLLDTHPKGLVNTKDNEGNTALIVALNRNDEQWTGFLLNKGADPDRADHAAGYSARDYAARDPRAREILKMIEDKKPKTAASAAR